MSFPPWVQHSPHIARKFYPTDWLLLGGESSASLLGCTWYDNLTRVCIEGTRPPWCGHPQVRYLRKVVKSCQDWLYQLALVVDEQPTGTWSYPWSVASGPGLHEELECFPLMVSLEPWIPNNMCTLYGDTHHLKCERAVMVKYVASLQWVKDAMAWMSHVVPLNRLNIINIWLQHSLMGAGEKDNVLERAAIAKGMLCTLGWNLKEHIVNSNAHLWIWMPKYQQLLTWVKLNAVHTTLKLTAGLRKSKAEKMKLNSCFRYLNDHIEEHSISWNWMIMQSNRMPKDENGWQGRN